MPWTRKQHNLFEARAHGADFPMARKIPVATARKMAGEGVKPGKDALVKALRHDR